MPQPQVDAIVAAIADIYGQPNESGLGSRPDESKGPP